MRSMAIGRGAGAAQAANANANAAAKVKQRAKPRFKSRLSSGSIYGFAERLALRCSQKAVRRIGKPADEAHLISDQTALSAPGSIDAAVFTAIFHRWAHLETPAWRGFADGTPPRQDKNRPSRRREFKSKSRSACWRIIAQNRSH